MLGRLKTLSIKAMVWSAGESFGVALLSLGVFMLMARLLEPEHFGLVALAGVFILSFNLIVGHSFADAIVQRTAIDREHLDTAFWTNLAVAVALAAVCHLGAGYAATRFGEPELADILPWLSWLMPLNAIGVVQTALFRRELQFRTVALRSLAGRAVGAATGVGMALGGFGVWSLVGQQLAGIAAVAIAMAASSPWRPGFRYSLPHLRSLWSFGFHVSATQVVAGLTEQVLNLLVGSLFGSVALGYFSIAWRVTQLIRSLIGSAVYHVSFSTFARLQEDRKAVAQAFLQATRLSCLFGFPIGAGMTVLAEPLIVALFGAKWGESVPLLSILALLMFPAFYMMFFTACYRAMDNASWVLGLSLLYLAAGIGFVLALSPYGIEAIAAAWVAKTVLLLPVHIALLRHMLGVSLNALVSPVLAPLAAAIVMAIVLIAAPWDLLESATPVMRLTIAIPVGAAVYAAAIFVISPALFQTAARTARIMITPQRASGS